MADFFLATIYAIGFALVQIIWQGRIKEWRGFLIRGIKVP
jgi:hypothetical protein